MKKLLSFILITTMFLSLIMSVFADVTEKPLQEKLIRVGVSADYPPFEYYDENNNLQGFDIELMNLVGKKCGYKIEYVNMDFGDLISSVINGKTDCAISSVAVTDERDKYIDFSREYLKTHNITYNNGQKSVKYGECYAIVFKEGLKDALYKESEILTDNEKMYVDVDEALKDLSNDKTVTKLIEKYELNKPMEENTDNVEYSAIIGGGEPSADTSATSNPPSQWATADIDKAYALNITNAGGNYNFPEAITREQFCELIYNYVSEFGELPIDDGHLVFTDTDNMKIRVLNTLGIIKGKSETQFAPDDLLTREEAATILNRLINTVHPDLASTELYFEFADSANISGWAMSDIQRICNMGVMKGVGNNTFAPKDNYTTEQAIATLVRIYAYSGVSKSDDMTFADNLNKNMPDDRNYMFSPLSIKSALMMAANGASGETLEEILNATGVSDINKYNQSMREMLDKYSESDILKLNISNSIWINSDKTSQRFSKNFKDLLSENFDATSDVVNDKNAVSVINGWVNEKTEGKIPSIISENNKDFGAMLINAVYFKGRWQSEFSKSATKKDTFTSKDGIQKDIDFMNKRGWISYSDTDGVKIVSLPYLTRQDIFDENRQYVETKKLDGVNIKMYLMMSEKDFSPEKVLKNTEMKSTYMNLSLPKFKVEYSAGLNDILKSVGINKTFEKTAEFEKMFDKGNMWIDSTLHKTYIKVDEEGTEAAAITSVGMAGSSLPPEPIDVKFNKPFTFVIMDDYNGEVLFMGQYAFAE